MRFLDCILTFNVLHMPFNLNQTLETQAKNTHIVIPTTNLITQIISVGPQKRYVKTINSVSLCPCF